MSGGSPQTHTYTQNSLTSERGSELTPDERYMNIFFSFIFPSNCEDLTLTRRSRSPPTCSVGSRPLPPRYLSCSGNAEDAGLAGRKETVLLYIFSTKIKNKKRQRKKKTVKMFEQGPDVSERFLKRTSEEKKNL